MGKVSEINNHDYLRCLVAFSDGTKANITWSRNGQTITVNPLDATRSEQLSLIVTQALGRSREPGYPHTNLGLQAKQFAEAGRQAQSLDEYLDLARKALQVTGERPKPKGAASAPDFATVSARKGRTWEMQIAFPSGERIELKIGKSSASIVMDPSIQSRETEILKAILNAKIARTLDDEAIVDLVKEGVPGSPDIATWQDEFLAGLNPARGMKP